MPSSNANTAPKAYFLTLLGLFSASLALPLFTTLANGTTFFVAHHSQASDILLFVCLVYLLPATAGYLLIHTIALFNKSLANFFAALIVAGLTALWLIALLKNLPVAIVASACLLTIVAVTICYQKFAALRSFLPTLGLISPLLPLGLIFLTPVNNLLFEPEEQSIVGSGGKPIPVLMLVLDELSLESLLNANGDIDRRRLPAFGRLADISSWYPDTTTVSSLTDRAVPALLSGNYVREQTAPLLAHYPNNLFTLLGPSHQIKAVESFTRLCPASLCNGTTSNSQKVATATNLYKDAAIVWLHAVLPSALAHSYLPSIDSSWADFGSTTLPIQGKDTAEESGKTLIGLADMQANDADAFKQFINQLTLDGTPTLNYFHLTLPHSPWRYLPNGTLYNGSELPGSAAGSYGWADSKYFVEQSRLRYAMQLEYVDSLLAKLLDQLEGSQQFEEMMLVVLADHGVAFEAGAGVRAPTANTLASIARVPLFIKYPGQTEPEVDRRRAETIDVIPTISAVLGIALPEKLDGRSLVGSSDATRTRSLLEMPPEIADFEQALQESSTHSGYNSILKGKTTALDALHQGVSEDYYQQAASNLNVSGDSSLSLLADNANWYQNVQLDNNFLPARFTARLEGVEEDSSEKTILIALNGINAGSGQSVGSKVSILLDSRLFVEGRNTVEAFVSHDKQWLRLPMSNQLPAYSLSYDNAGQLQTVRLNETLWTPVNANAEQLKADARQSAQGEKMPSIGGWVYNTETEEAASTLFLVLDGKVQGNSFRRFPLLLTEEFGFKTDAAIGFFTHRNHDELEENDRYLVVALFDNGEFAAIPVRH